MTTPATRAHFWDFPAELPDGAWSEKRRLASTLRELVAICVTTDAPEDQLAQANLAARAIVDQLGAHPRGTFLDAFGGGPLGDVTRFADRGTMVGLSNPISPPMSMRDDGEQVTGHVTFGAPFEGAPGCVHGGMLAAAFDQTFGFLNVVRKVGAMTAQLNVHYRKPTPILKPLRIEARTDRVDGKKRWVSARMFSGDEVTAEAQGLFIALAPGQVQAIVDAQRSDVAKD
jgi:acyl-coenzyme A thioesterase PaaI-like protein